MRIAHVLPALGPGGAERIVMELARRSAEGGDEVTLVLGYRGSHHEEYMQRLPSTLLVEFIAPSGASRIRLYAAAAAWVRRRRRWLQGLDVLHCHLTLGAVVGTLAYRARPDSMPRIVETYHAMGMGIRPSIQWIHQRLVRDRDAVVLMADPDQSWTRVLEALRGTLVRRILNGAATPVTLASGSAEVQRVRERLRIPAEGGPVVGSVGLLRSDRRPELLVRAFSRIKRECAEAHFLLIGGGPERQKLESLAAEQGISERLRITGTVTDPGPFLSLLDLYVTVNVGPVTGVAAMEAALAGLPVIAVQLREDYSNRPEDWIWSSRDVEEVAVRAVNLLRDAAARSAVAARQQAYARKHHSFETMFEAYHRLYSDLIAQPSPIRVSADVFPTTRPPQADLPPVETAD